jgi:trimethylamine--corrinoid protein Co-methyltransferase
MQNQLHKTANYHRRIFDMDINIKRFNSTPLEYLREDQMRDIHTAALEILEDTGTIVHHDKALALLHSAGAHVKDGNRAYLPGGLVEKAIQSAPSRITIYNRNGNPAMYLEGRRVYYGTGSDCPNLLDSFSGERREFLSADVEDAVKLVDNLPYVDFVMSMGLAPDIPIELQYQKKYAIMIRNSIKPQVITAANKASLNDIIDIAAAVIGGREELSRKPLFVLYDEPTSPLVHTREALEKLLFMAENRLPINYSLHCPGQRRDINRVGHSPVTKPGGTLCFRSRHVTHGYAEHATHVFFSGSHGGAGRVVSDRTLPV